MFSEFPAANSSRKYVANTVNKVEWQVEAYVPGFSSNLAEYQYPAYQTEKILKRNEGIVFCYAAPKLKEGYLPASLEWRVGYKRVNFAP